MATTMIMDTPNSPKRRRTDPNSTDCPFSPDSLKELIKIIDDLHLIGYWHITYQLLQSDNIQNIWKDKIDVIQSILRLKQRPIAALYLNIQYLPIYAKTFTLRYDAGLDVIHFGNRHSRNQYQTVYGTLSYNAELQYPQLIIKSTCRSVAVKSHKCGKSSTLKQRLLEYFGSFAPPKKICSGITTDIYDIYNKSNSKHE
eukprot:715250_1